MSSHPSFASSKATTATDNNNNNTTNNHTTPSSNSTTNAPICIDSDVKPPPLAYGTQKVPTAQVDNDHVVDLVDSAEEKSYDDYVYDVLNSRKSEAKSLNERQNYLYEFMNTCGPRFFEKCMRDENSEVQNFFADLKVSAGASKKSRERAWKGSYVARKLIVMDKLMVDNDTVRKKMKAQKPGRSSVSPRQDPPIVALFRTFMKNVHKRADNDQHKESIIENTDAAPKVARVGKKSVLKPGEQKGEPVQSFLLWDESRRDKITCPACMHPFAMIIGSDKEINESNDEATAKLIDAIDEWKKRNPRSRGKKPTFSTVLGSTEIVCMCTTMHCGNREDGVGCIQCEEVVENNGTRPPLIDARICSCQVCRCDCSVKYQRKDRHKVAMQASADRHKVKNGINTVPSGPGKSHCCSTIIKLYNNYSSSLSFPTLQHLVISLMKLKADTPILQSSRKWSIPMLPNKILRRMWQVSQLWTFCSPSNYMEMSL
jgi:hypothetical protein